MDGTNHASSGPGGITPLRLTLRWRIAGFITAVVVGALIIGWIDINTWQQIRDLELEFSDVKAERYYLGVQARVRIGHVNDALLAYHRKRDPADLALFLKHSQSLADWVEDKRSSPQSDKARAVYVQLAQECAAYLTNTAALLRPNEIRSENDPFETVYERLRAVSQPPIRLATGLSKILGEDFDTFIEQSQHTLDSFQHLIWLSIILLLALSVTLVALVYRGMIAPLRLQLDQTQAIINRQEKLASLGVLAAGVAHEIRNPLTAIKFRLFSLKKSLPAVQAESEDATVIGSELNRLERIVRDFLQFARPSDPDLLRVPALRILQEVHSLLNSQMGKANIQLRIEGRDDLWVNADSQQLKQVLINLIQNAAESIGRKGTITLRALHDRATIAGTSQPVTCFEVIDSGRGIPPEVERRLFDPFFTTKEGGTGLGLPIAARIVEKHGGELRYQTQLNRGTTFRIVLPRPAPDEA